MTGWFIKRLSSAVLVFVTGTVSSSVYAGTSPEEQENPRRIVSEWSISAGRADMLSTYLSPLNYSGFSPSLMGTWSKGMPFDPRRWRMRFEAELGAASLSNSPGTASEYDVTAAFSWGMERVWHTACGFSFSCGGNVGFDAEALWNPRNSNNPVSLPLRADLSVTASASYDLHFGRLPVTLSERVAVPSLGIFFMPGYGESFYEIYLGNTSGLVHCGWWGNAAAVRSHLQMTLHFRKASLSIGYLLDYSRTAANSLENRRVLNALTVTLVK